MLWEWILALWGVGLSALEVDLGALTVALGALGMDLGASKPLCCKTIVCLMVWQSGEFPG